MRTAPFALRAGLLSTFLLALLGALALGQAVSFAAHPTGDVDPAAARRAGIHPSVQGVGCMDCHDAHGVGAEDMLTGHAQTAGCLECHSRLGQNLRGSHPWGVRVDGASARAMESLGFLLGPQDSVACLSCHTAHQEKSAQDGCASCHRTQGQALRSGGQEGHAGVACLECHAVHPGIGDTAHRKASAGDPEGCLSCHAPGRPAAVVGVSPGRLGHPVAGATTDKGEAMRCGTCHDTHAPQVAAGSGCAECHRDQDQARARGGHGEESCGSCHPVHGAAPMESRAAAALDVNPRSKACLACHGEKVGRGKASRVAEYEHPTPVFDLQGKRWTPLAGLPLFAADGSLLPEGVNGALTCGSCHLTHGPGSDKDRDKLRLGGWEAACAACHGDDALPLYRYFHQPARRTEVTAPAR